MSGRCGPLRRFFSLSLAGVILLGGARMALSIWSRSPDAGGHVLVISSMLWNGLLVLWIGFLVDFRTCYVVYFDLATFHMLVEVPFLLRLL